MPLTPDQIDHFVRRGFLRLPGAVSSAGIARWLEDAFERLQQAPERYVKEWFDPAIRTALANYSRDQPATWMAGRISIEGRTNTPLRIVEVAPAAWEAMVELVGGDPERLASDHWPGGVIADHRLPGVASAPPSEPEPLVGPNAFHVDQPMPDAVLQGYRLGFVTLILLEDIAPGEGATVLVGDSIGPIATAMLDAPGGSYDLTRNSAIAAMWERFNDRVEATGEAGDVYLSHSLVAHAAGPARLRHGSQAPWLRLLANPCTELRGGLRFGKAALDPPAPIDRAVTFALGDRAAQMSDWSPVPSQRDTSRAEHHRHRERGSAPGAHQEQHRAPRRLALHDGLVDALASVGTVVFASMQQQEMTLALQRGDETVFVRVLQPDNLPYRLPFATADFGVAYKGRIADGPALCEQVGEALMPVAEPLVAMLKDNGASSRWSEPELTNLLATAGDPSGAETDIRLLDALLERTWSPLDADTLALAALMLGQLDALEALAATTSHHGWLLPILVDGLAERTAEAVDAIRALVGDRRSEPALRAALGRLAAIMGHDTEALDILEDAAESMDRQERARALLDVITLRLREGRAPQSLRPLLDDARTGLEDDVAAMVPLAQVASLLGAYEVAEHTLVKASRHHSLPEAFVALAELRLARGDQAGAEEAATLGRRSQDPRLVARLARVMAGEATEQTPSTRDALVTWARRHRALAEHLTAMWLRG